MTVMDTLGGWYEHSIGLIHKQSEEKAPISTPVEIETYKTNIYFKENVEAGPFVRFDGVSWGKSPVWRASALIVTKEGGIPPYMTYCGRRIAPSEVFSLGDKSLWKYPLEASLELSSRYIHYSIGGEGFKCFVPNKEDSWRVQYFPNGVVEEEITDESGDEEGFGSIFTERTALHVIEVASSLFMNVFEISEVKEWAEQIDSDMQSSLMMNESTKGKVRDFFLASYSQVFSDSVGKEAPYLALSGGESLCRVEWFGMPFSEELTQIDTLFKNIFFHHTSSSPCVNELSQPFALYDLQHYHWLSLDLNVVRTKEKWMLNRTWRAIISSVTECCRSGAKEFVINVNIPLVAENPKDEADSVSLISYLNPLEYLNWDSCQYETQLEAFFAALQGLEEKFPVSFLMISNHKENNRVDILKLLKSGEQAEERDDSLLPISQRLTLVNSVSCIDDERLEVNLGLARDLELTNKKEVVVYSNENVLSGVEVLTLKETKGFGLNIWPFRK